MITGLQVYRPGTGWVLPLQDRVVLQEGDVLHIQASVPYKGPEKTYTLYASIGQRGMLGFDEILTAESALPCPKSEDNFVTVSGSVDILVNIAGVAGIGGISPGVNYDLMVKIKEAPSVYAEADDIIDIEGVAGGGMDLTSMMGGMMGIMMMGMVFPLIMPMLEEGMGGEEGMEGGAEAAGMM